MIVIVIWRMKICNFWNFTRIIPLTQKSISLLEVPHLKSSKLNKSWRHLLEELQLSYFSSCQNIRILCCQLNTGKNFTIKLKLLLMLNFVLLIFCHSHFVIRYIFIISLLLDISLLTQKRVFKNTFSLFCFNNFHFFFFF